MMTVFARIPLVIRLEPFFFRLEQLAINSLYAVMRNFVHQLRLGVNKSMLRSVVVAFPLTRTLIRDEAARKGCLIIG